jgi:hypothetical protein
MAAEERLYTGVPTIREIRTELGLPPEMLGLSPQTKR